jgi:hypothetical protein
MGRDRLLANALVVCVSSIVLLMIRRQVQAIAAGVIATVLMQIP